MNWINGNLTAISSLVLRPFASWPAQVTLVIVSVLAGIAMTIVFRHTSNQRALKAVANRTRAHLMCMKLFRDDLRVALSCQGSLLKSIGLRLCLAMPPMAVLLIPFVFILAQLALRYENRPLMPGDSVVAALHLSEAAWSTNRDTAIQVPLGIQVETPPLRDDAKHTIYWRLRVDKPSTGSLRWRVGPGAGVAEKTIVSTADPGRLLTVSAHRPGPGFWDRLLRPGEPGFDADGPVEAIDLYYPRRSTPFFGVDIPWWATFLIASMIAALCVRPFLKVQF